MDQAGMRSISPEALRGHVERLAGDIGERNVFRPQALARAADYIEATWRSQGYPCTRQWYEARGVRSANLEITRRGEARPDELLLLGAHYDTVMGSPGANDNGSGVAALLEPSRLFALAAPAMTVRFVAFVGELASNTAIAAVFLPVAGATALGMGEPAFLLTLPVALFASLGFMLPVATPPNAVIFGSGVVEIRHMLRAGVILDLAGIVVVSLAILTLGEWVLGSG